MPKQVFELDSGKIVTRHKATPVSGGIIKVPAKAGISGDIFEYLERRKRSSRKTKATEYRITAYAWNDYPRIEKISQDKHFTHFTP